MIVMYVCLYNYNTFGFIEGVHLRYMEGLAVNHLKALTSYLG